MLESSIFLAASIIKKTSLRTSHGIKQKTDHTVQRWAPKHPAARSPSSDIHHTCTV